MTSQPNALLVRPAAAPRHGFRLVVEPEPWLRSFWRNLADCFRSAPPPLRTTSPPGRYWADALVHRPVAWKQMGQSLFAHTVVVAAIVTVDWLGLLEQPRVAVDEQQRTTSILQYQVSEYLPEVRPREKQDQPPVRHTAQAADPEYSPQKIVSLNPEHDSIRQTIIQPDPNILRQDVPLPNLVIWTPAPGAPLASRNRFEQLPAGTPQVVPPAQAVAEHSPLVFPLARQPVVAPPTPVSGDRATQVMLAMNSPVVIPPASEMAASDPSRLQLPLQAPQAVAGPPSTVASGHVLGQALPNSDQPEVVPPAQGTGQRNLAAIAMPGLDPAAVPPAQPASGGMGQTHSREVGQLLALNARPTQPVGPLTVPAGNRRGEFTAGPEGRVGASGAPQTVAGDPAIAGRAGSGSGLPDSGGSISVSAPPRKVISGMVIAGAPEPPRPALLLPNNDNHDIPSSGKIEDEVFAGRRQHNMYINMPNLTSAMGSWAVRFAEMKSEDEVPGELTSPEAVRKVDPAYPASLLRDRIEGVVILHAVIHRDGSVGDVSVLEGCNEQLDANARTALLQWRFRPGLKNGVPVDVEAVIRVPFRVPRVGF
ncbi:MAG TPA: TonB family protein [Candidatus Angelobacter sp.]|nr:TonB family protein [Candidatus Angelobacter sp.]